MYPHYVEVVLEGRPVAKLGSESHIESMFVDAQSSEMLLAPSARMNVGR